MKGWPKGNFNKADDKMKVAALYADIKLSDDDVETIGVLEIETEQREAVWPPGVTKDVEGVFWEEGKYGYTVNSTIRN